MDNSTTTCATLASHFGINPKNFQRYYKDNLSNFRTWTHRDHAKEYLIYSKNIGAKLTIDETSLSNGELYTIITNKAKKGKKGSIVAIIKGVKTNNIVDLINEHIPLDIRKRVKEVTLDMANNMNAIIKGCFSKATIVIDRFHVQKLVCDAVQSVRVKFRWEHLENENQLRDEYRKNRMNYKPVVHSNGDTTTQLLVRSRYLLFKPRYKWSESQRERAGILFNIYPEIKEAYELSYELYQIYNKRIEPEEARVELSNWYQKIGESELINFNTVMNTFINFEDKIVNFFCSRSTNAAAESFNAKIKEFRAKFRGVRDVTYFLFRVSKIYA